MHMATKHECVESKRVELSFYRVLCHLSVVVIYSSSPQSEYSHIISYVWKYY